MQKTSARVPLEQLRSRFVTLHTRNRFSMFTGLLDDELWKLIEPLLPVRKPSRRTLDRLVSAGALTPVFIDSHPDD